jgi:hypothetical protein
LYVYPLLLSYNLLIPFLNDPTFISINSFALPTPFSVLFMSLSRYVPSSVMDFFFAHGTERRVRRIRELKEQTTKVARVLLDEKARALRDGGEEEGKRDIMSLIGRHLLYLSSDSDLV